MWGRHSDYGFIERLRRRTVTASWICLLPVVLLAGAWRLGGASALEDDLIYYLPVRQFIGERLRSGDLPLWNPFVSLGTSLAADPQAGLWYPATYLFALLPPLWAYPLVIVLHFVLAGAGMYRFLRALRLEERACLFGALAYEFSGFLVAHRVHLTMLQAAAWLPWILWAWRRYADTGRYRHFTVGALAIGLSLLVQHMQVSIISLSLAAAYAALLSLRRRSLLWACPAGLLLGGMLSAVQTLPTLAALTESVRSRPAFHLFVENSWTPLSAVMMVFPWFYGGRTPGLWIRPWWGVSHFCEQWAYATLPVLLLALCSLAWLRRRVTWIDGGGAGVPNAAPRDAARREIIFWWGAVLVALPLALGGYTPLSEWLFHLPVYCNLRSPARWILIWSVALPVLAASVVSCVHRGGRERDQIRRHAGWLIRRAIPAGALISVLAVLVLREHIGHLEGRWVWWRSAEFWAGLRATARLTEPAVWWPLVLMFLTGHVVWDWLQQPSAERRARAWSRLFAVFLLDLAAVVPFVDVDMGTCARKDLLEPPPLQRAIQAHGVQPGQRLLVPRFHADYDRPLEVLWPQSNLRWRTATVNGYGPLGGMMHRSLLGFAPWGSSEHIVTWLRHPALCRMLGLRFVAVRSPQERQALAWAAAPAVAGHEVSLRERVQTPAVVSRGADVLLPVVIDSPGLYELKLGCEPVTGESGRVFIRLESTAGTGIGETRSLEPADLALGARQVRFLFGVDRASASTGAGGARIRIKSERGTPLRITDASLRRIASEPFPGDRPGQVFENLEELPGGITLYALRMPPPLCRWAERTVLSPSPAETVRRLLEEDIAWDRVALVEKETALVSDFRPRPDQDPDACLAEGIEIQGEPMGDAWGVTVETSEPRLLIIGQSYDPGWHVELDGQPVVLERVHAVLQGVYVPPGRHRLTLDFRPVGLREGAGLSLVTLGVLLLPLIARFKPWAPRGQPSHG